MNKLTLIKLISGEEIIGAVQSSTDDILTLSKPRKLAVSPMEDGRLSLSFLPVLFGNPGCDVDINVNTIMCVATSGGGDSHGITPELEKGYLQDTTGIHLS